jgi:DNA replication protein DnaC
MVEPMRVDVDAMRASLSGAGRALANLRSTLPQGFVVETETSESREDYEARMAAAAVNRRARWERRLPKRWADASVADLTADQDPAGVVSGWWESGHATLFLYAEEPGVGKTHAAFAVGAQAVEAGATVEAWTTITLLSAMRPDGDPDALPHAMAADLLVLDDLGRESDSEWTRQQLHSILDARLANGRRTVVTTNLRDEQMESRYGAPLVDRLVDDAVIVEVRGESRRRPARWGA